MKTQHARILVLVSVLLFALVGLPMGVATAQAIICTPDAYVAVSTQYSGVNIRPNPDTTLAPLGSLKPTQGFQPSDDSTIANGGWYKLCGSGWMAGSYLTIRTSTPAPTIPVKTPSLSPTLTRQVSNTPSPIAPGPSLTPAPQTTVIVVMDEEGVKSFSIVCVSACQIWATVEELPVPPARPAQRHDKAGE